jgi:hypothetical protein
MADTTHLAGWIQPSPRYPSTKFSLAAEAWTGSEFCIAKPKEGCMKAIETFYDGHKFRSRTEARWAVFFNSLGLEYRYEYEGFLLVPPGEPYLPDFYLPELGYWIEVKGTVPTEAEQRKASLLNYGLIFDEATERERVYILYGDIP